MVTVFFLPGMDTIHLPTHLDHAKGKEKQKSVLKSVDDIRIMEKRLQNQYGGLYDQGIACRKNRKRDV